jgi:Flp pilus assembly protein CpaB
MARPRSFPRSLPRPRLALRRRWRRARRSPALWWSAAAATAAAAALQVSSLDGRATARREAWGESEPVVVATHDLEAGAVIGPGDVTVEQWPHAVVPSGAITEVPTGQVVIAAVVDGEAVIDRRLAPEGLRGVAALVPDHHRAIAVPSSAAGFGTDAPPLSAGDRVDVLATFDVVDGDAPPTAPVAEAALVVDVGEGTVTVAVPVADAPRVAFAVARGTVTLALVGAS